MSKLMWYYQMMGAEIGPLTAAQLVEKVRIGQVQPDTLVRQGDHGKWIPADRWKGLLPKPETEELPPVSPPTMTPNSSESTLPATGQSEVPTATASDATPTVVAPVTSDDSDDAYHLKGGSAEVYRAPHADGFEFFEFVGFRQAITPALFDVLAEHSRIKRLTVTQITRRAIAQFLGKPELGEDKPAENPADAPPAEPASNA